jgi:hypothetical protein
VTNVSTKNSSIGMTRSPFGPFRDDLCTEREHGCRMIIGRIAVRQVAPDCSEITDQWIGDHQCCVVEDRVLLADQRRTLEVDSRTSAPIRKSPSRSSRKSSPGTLLDCRSRNSFSEPKLHHGNETLPATQNLGVASELCEQRDCFLHGRYPAIAKWPGNHHRSSFRSAPVQHARPSTSGPHAR